MIELSVFFMFLLNLILIVFVFCFELWLLGLMDTQGGESAVDGGGEWRSQLQAESRQRIINKMYVYFFAS